MTKTVCDICGEEMPPKKVLDNIENLNFCISSYGRIWDICTECRESLNRWMTIRGQKGEEECLHKAESEERRMTKEQKDKILKALAEDRNDYARGCQKRVEREWGKIEGADYMLQRFLDILNAEVESQEKEGK